MVILTVYKCAFQPQPLAFLEEDIREVLKQETGADIFNRTDVQHDYRTWKHVCALCKLFCPVLQPVKIHILK